MTNPLSDPFLWGAIGLRLLLFVILGNPLSDGYHVESTSNPLDWEETYIMLVSIPEAIGLFWLTRYTVDGLVSAGFPIVVPIAKITLFSVVLGGIYLPLRWGYAWFKSLQEYDTTRFQSIIRLAGFLTTVMFGLWVATAIYVAGQPSGTQVNFLFEKQVNVATQLVRQFEAVLGLQLPVIQPFIDVMISIFVNNALLGVRAAIIGLIGGLVVGLGIPAVLIMGANAAILAGIFTGVLIRNSIIAGNTLLSPAIAYLATIGLPPVAHGFHEFMGIIVAGIGAGFVGLGIARTRGQASVAGAKMMGLGFVQIAFAAFVEVFFDPRIISFLKGLVTIQPRIVDLNPSSGFAIGLTSTILTSALMAAILIVVVRKSVFVLEGAS